MYRFPVEKQEVKFSTEKYEMGSQINKNNKIQSILKLNAYFILSWPGTFLLQFLPTKIYPESKRGTEKMGLPYASGARFALPSVHSHCSKWSNLFSYLFIILNFLMSTLCPFSSQGDGPKYINLLLKQFQRCHNIPTTIKISWFIL